MLGSLWTDPATAYDKIAEIMPPTLRVDGIEFHAASRAELHTHGVDPDSGAWGYLALNVWPSQAHPNAAVTMVFSEPEHTREQWQDVAQAKCRMAHQTIRRLLESTPDVR